MNSLLPPNATELERTLETVLSRAGTIPVPLRDLWNSQTCPEALLPWLAWTVGVVDWSSDWDVTARRAAIAQAIPIHRHRGTIGALRRALSVLGYTIDVREWFQLTPRGTPGTFSLDVQISGQPVAASLYSEVVRIAYAAKNLRSHLLGVRLIGAVAGSLFVAGHAYAGNEITINPYVVTDASVESTAYIAAAVQRSATVQINPASAD